MPEKKRMQIDKRKDLRVDTKEPLILKFSIKQKKAIFNLLPKKTTRAQNLSVGGMRIELPLLEKKQIDKINEGEYKLILELNIPSLRKPLRITGKIVWLQKKDIHGKNIYETGISFEGLKHKDREKILSQLLNICLKNSCEID